MRDILSAVICASAFASPAVLAGVTGNVGGVSEYMFRGVPQSGGAAIQGGLDVTTDVGVYAGTWGSNIGFAGGTELDGYAGFTKKFGDFGFDVGAIYYWYSEEDEAATKADTAELYVGALLGPVTLKYSFAEEANFFGTPDLVTGKAEDAAYLSLALALPITETLAFNANVGQYSGDGVEDFLAQTYGSTDDAYLDFGVGLARTLDNGITATFSFIATDIEAAGPVEDDPKFVIGLKKSFDL